MSSNTWDRFPSHRSQTLTLTFSYSFHSKHRDKHTHSLRSEWTTHYSPQARCCCTMCLFQEEDARKNAQVSLLSMKTIQKWVCRLIKLYKVCVLGVNMINTVNCPITSEDSALKLTERPRDRWGDVISRQRMRVRGHVADSPIYYSLWFIFIILELISIY